MPAACADQAEKRRDAVQTVVAAVNTHADKVGVILPLTGPKSKFANYIVQGIRAAFQESGGNMDDVVVLKDSAGLVKTAESKLAELVFKDKVGIVMGGLDRAEADMLAAWSKELMMPLTLLSRDREAVGDSPWAFRVYPDEKRLAETLVAAGLKRGLKRVSIVRPDNHKSDKIADYFRKALAANGGQVVNDLVYTPGNFDSMQATSRQLFQIDANNRRDEYRAAYMKARADAAKEGVPFDQRMVVLRPIINFDAVFIPDDFLSVRHFAKLFKFHMVDKLPLIGNHEWRSPALVEPWDSFLEGSFFADFIGSYQKLPSGLAAETVGSPYFVRPQQVVVTDFQLIGYRAGKVARLTVDGGKGKTRREFNRILAALSSDGQNFFGAGKIFDDARQSNWPTYLFSVSKGELVLANEDQSLQLSAPASAPAVRATPIVFSPPAKHLEARDAAADSAPKY